MIKDDQENADENVDDEDKDDEITAPTVCTHEYT